MEEAIEVADVPEKSLWLEALMHMGPLPALLVLILCGLALWHFVLLCREQWTRRPLRPLASHLLYLLALPVFYLFALALQMSDIGFAVFGLHDPRPNIFHADELLMDAIQGIKIYTLITLPAFGLNLALTLRSIRRIHTGGSLLS